MKDVYKYIQKVTVPPANRRRRTKENVKKESNR